jgi:transposase InsO family protein
MTAWLRRQRYDVSQQRVERLMRQEGSNGRVCGRGVRTTTPNKNADRTPDLMERNFGAAAPTSRWVADFTYVRTWAVFVYAAFVIDCYSRAIVGWHAATTKQTPLVTCSPNRYEESSGGLTWGACLCHPAAVAQAQAPVRVPPRVRRGPGRTTLTVS